MFLKLTKMVTLKGFFNYKNYHRLKYFIIIYLIKI